MERMVTAVEIARRHHISDKRLRGILRRDWPWPRCKHDFWTFPAGSEQAAMMEMIAKRLAAA
ncbi:hypothetical protein Sj15T_20990 [Sphingobium sp. TA15]|uniref:Uncharacterized protein n=1 Tax=Sphingobium indicum (strain DSM 16413 / CCM 7287 / MTCC 6362 / UT26 / NBRC 101211 / UT26S) TaxID=452662 RepID=D4Z4Z0_SPHIU|nr:hypothetical protein [Sphingobium indicum]BAI97672.1 hypothetical protein SJA_C1-28380 [Sphingobium indicum UT26S]BDD67078.1 hypothetical protein Sj15T_20990 [Sphingobium sp. TA15]